MKWYTKLEVAQKMCPIVFLGHLSNFKVTPIKKIVELGVSGLELQFEFTDGFEVMHKAWCSIEGLPYYFL